MLNSLIGCIGKIFSINNFITMEYAGGLMTGDVHSIFLRNACVDGISHCSASQVVKNLIIASQFRAVALGVRTDHLLARHAFGTHSNPRACFAFIFYRFADFYECSVPCVAKIGNALTIAMYDILAVGVRHLPWTPRSCAIY